MTLSVFSACDTTGYVPAAASTAVRWHPGVFVLPLYNSATNTPSNWDTVKSELQAYDALRGVQLRFNWNQIEVAEGDYSGIDTVIKPYLAEIGALGSGATRKRVHILWHIRHSHGTSILSANDMVPDYMIGNPTYGGGQWYFETATVSVPGKGGKMICWWDSNVRAKAALLAQALADELNAYVTLDLGGSLTFNPLEGISVSETATGDPVPIPNTDPALPDQPSGVSFPANWEEKYWEGYYMFVKNLRDSFDNTWVGAFCNHERRGIEPIIAGGSFYSGSSVAEGLIDIGAALGNPNTLPDDPGLRGDLTDGSGNPGVYFYYSSSAGVVPLTPSWQKPDYIWTVLGGTLPGGIPTGDPDGHHPTIQEMYEYTRDELHATHLFATRTDDATYWTDFKNYLTSTGLRNIVTGGLTTTAPSCFSSVDTN